MSFNECHIAIRCQIIGKVANLTFECAQWCQKEFESRGHRSRAKVGGGTGAVLCAKKIIGRAPTLFGSKSTIRFGERYRDVGVHTRSLVSLFFAVLLTVPPMPRHL